MNRLILAYALPPLQDFFAQTMLTMEGQQS